MQKIQHDYRRNIFLFVSFAVVIPCDETAKEFELARITLRYIIILPLEKL